MLVIGAGITLHNALKAADHLAGMGVHVRVLDPFTVKPLDVATVRDNARQCGGRVLTVEDHYPAGEQRGRDEEGGGFKIGVMRGDVSAQMFV